VAAMVDAIAGGAPAVAGPTWTADPTDPWATSSQLITNLLAERSRRAGAPFAPTSNVAVRADVAAAVPFDEGFPLAAGEDREWCDRLAARGHRVTVIAPSADKAAVREARAKVRSVLLGEREAVFGPDEPSPRYFFAGRTYVDARRPRPVFTAPVDLVANIDVLLEADDLDLMRYGVLTARRGWATCESVVSTWPAERILAWLGGKAFDAEGRPTFDDPSMAAALTQYAALISKATPPSPEPLAEVFFDGVRGMSGNVYPTPISSGQVAMWVERYRSSLDMLPLTYTPGVAPLPAGTQPLSGISPSGLFISAQAPNPEACWAWIAFVSTQPEAVSLLPVRRDMIRDPTWRKRAGEDVAEAWLTILERGEALPSSSLTNATSRATYWLHGALADVLAGSSPTSALAAAQKKALAYAACVAAHGQQVSEETLRACAREADPEVRMGP